MKINLNYFSIYNSGFWEAGFIFCLLDDVSLLDDEEEINERSNWFCHRKFILFVYMSPPRILSYTGDKALLG